LPSLQVVPFVAVGFVQAPVDVLQVPATWHWSSAVQTTGFAPVQVPDWQVSVCVQAFPSLQVVPLVAAGFEHAPVEVLHVPAVWHWSLAVQTTGLLPVQVPAWQVSVCVHAFPSLHAVPFVTDVCVHVPPVHASVVQAFPSSQEPEQLLDPNPSWQVTVAPEFIRISCAAIAP
jgi:hypothetical protein